MLRIFFTLVGLAMSVNVHAECKIYKGDYASYSNLVGTIKGDKMYRGDYASYSKLLGTIKKDKIYKGDYASYSKLVATGKNCSQQQLGFAAVFLLN